MKKYLLCVLVFCILFSIIVLHEIKIKEKITSFPKELSMYDESAFIINEMQFCDRSSRPVLLVGVYSSAGQDLERDFIRKTWGRVAKTNPKIKLLFFMGVPKIEEEMDSIRNESNQFHDIIVRNFFDTYRNLTLKSFAFFHWSQKYCKRAKYLLKIDCDMQIDLSRLVVVLKTGSIPDTFQCGKVLFDSTPYRDKRHKWYISPTVYAGNLFPIYCYGPAYVVSRRIASKIAARSIPKDPFPVDDVYITGILREELHENLRQDFLFFHHHYDKTKTKIGKGKYRRYIMTVHVLYEIIK